MQAVQLALQCLSFDFVGTCLDESSEDLGTIQVPSGEIQLPTTAQGLCWAASAGVHGCMVLRADVGAPSKCPQVRSHLLLRRGLPTSWAPGPRPNWFPAACIPRWLSADSSLLLCVQPGGHRLRTPARCSSS